MNQMLTIPFRSIVAAVISVMRNIEPHTFLRFLRQKIITVADSATAKQIINSALIRVNPRFNICCLTYGVKSWLGFAVMVEQHRIIRPAAYGHIASP